MNVAARKSLRPYQARLIADVCRANGPALVEQPTGSGKTMQIVTLERLGELRMAVAQVVRFIDNDP